MSATFVMYHCTSSDRAAAIIAEGFKRPPGSVSLGGVDGAWLSLVPVTPNEGAKGCDCIELTFDGTIDRLADYAIIEGECQDPETGEWMDTGITEAWEWIVPLDLVNAARRRLLTDDEAWDLRCAHAHPAPLESKGCDQ